MSPIASLPEVAAAVDDAVLAPSVLQALHRVQVCQELALPSQCELALAPPPPEGEERFALGSRLDLWVGEPQELLFSGDITAVEHVYGPSHQDELRVRAYDRLHRLRKRQPVRAHRQVTARQLAVELTAELGLAVEAAAEGPPWEQIIQHRQSDFELLVEVTRQCGLYPYLRGEELHLLTLAGTGPAVALTRGENLLEGRVEHNGEAACQRVRAAGWDPLRVEGRIGESTQARVDPPGTGLVAPEALGGSGQRFLAGQTASTPEHLDAAAQAELDRRAAHGTTLRGVADGDPRLQPGAQVVLEEVVPALAGRYSLTRAVHLIDGPRGFVTEISTAVPPPLSPAGGVIATLGIVSRIDDPERVGRVKVRLPAYDALESAWLHVVSPGAGAEKGLMAVPAVDDTVLILCSDRDPGAGLVLGGLYGMAGPADSGVEGNATQRYIFRTPGGQQVQLDDEHQTLALQDQSGSRIELSPDRLYLHAAADLELEAPGRSVIIRGQHIDFQRG